MIGTSVSPEVKMAKNIRREKTAELGFSFCPRYSIEQLRRINGLEIRKAKYGHRNAIAGLFPIRKQLLTKSAFNQEAIL
jgi:hypothetical protein